jgi:electron-transferring-flavoprotein dehydrogenase
MNETVEHSVMEVDIACVGFGPAMGGFLTTLSRKINNEDGSFIESAAMPGMPLQVICYERGDDISFGVSGVVSKARGIRESFPDLEPGQIPMCSEVKKEEIFYLLDPHGASRRSKSVKFMDAMIKAFRFMLPVRDSAVKLPYIPSFLEKHGGLILSMGQFQQWVGSQIMSSGTAQIWPASPVSEALLDGNAVKGVRLMDQGTDKQGNPEAGFMPGMDVHAGLTVVADGPVGAVGRQLDQTLGLPEGHHQREWAIGMKMVVELPGSCQLEPGTVIHTMGYPEPEIFGFLYVYPDSMASVGLFVPSWFSCPTRTAYRYLQHFMKHPKIWQHLNGGKVKSWGAKSLQESGRIGEPHLVGDGFARIGEGSGSTNILSGSGVDEAWTSGVQLAEGVLELLEKGEPFSAENLERTYVKRRRESWLDQESKIAEKARNGFQRGFIRGLLGMGMTGLTKGKFNLKSSSKKACDYTVPLEEYFRGKIPVEELNALRKKAENGTATLHDLIMDRIGWPSIELDEQLMISHQDALLLGGKVQGPAGFKDHVQFKDPDICRTCGVKRCISACSGQAITPGEAGVPHFESEKCVHCGACLWNCTQGDPDHPEQTNIEFSAGPGGLHSAEN